MIVPRSSSTSPGVPWVIQAALFAARAPARRGLRWCAAPRGRRRRRACPTRASAAQRVRGAGRVARGHRRADDGPDWRRYFPIVGTIFFFILIVEPDGPDPRPRRARPATRTSTWAWAMISFAVYKSSASASTGWNYLIKFMGRASSSRHDRRPPHPRRALLGRSSSPLECSLAPRAHLHAGGAAAREHVRRPHRGRASGIGLVPLVVPRSSWASAWSSRSSRPSCSRCSR